MSGPPRRTNFDSYPVTAETSGPTGESIVIELALSE